MDGLLHLLNLAGLTIKGLQDQVEQLQRQIEILTRPTHDNGGTHESVKD